MYSRITDTITKRTGISADAQHTHHQSLANIDIIDNTDGTHYKDDIDPSRPDEVLFFNGQFVVSVQNERIQGDGGRLERAYGYFFESKPYNEGVTLNDIVECFERFIDENDMQGYGNVITTLCIDHSPVFAKCKEISIEFE